MGDRVTLTEDRIRAFPPPERGEAVLWDATVTGFGVRCFPVGRKYPAGRKVFILMYRPRSIANPPKRRMTIGEFGSISLYDARAAAKSYLGQVAMGGDPQAARKEVARRQASRLDVAIEAYGRHLERRHVVHAAQIVRNLKRYMPGPLDKVELPAIDRHCMAQQIAKIEAQAVGDAVMRKRSRTKQGEKTSTANVRRKIGGPGAAADFRTKAHTFFNWAVGQGLIYANPLAGWRRERLTRVQLTNRTGRALSDDEIKAVWDVCDLVPAPYGDFVRLLLLTGQRRTETSRIRWSDVDVRARTWTIPETVAKNGRRHVVPLPAEAYVLLMRQPRSNHSEFVFAGRNGGSSISNWSKRHGALVKKAGVSFTLHDLRRTFRSGLRKVGVDTELAEMMLNHSRAELVEIYDREPLLAERSQAAERWAQYVMRLVSPAAGEFAVRSVAQEWDE
jgi:integrase